MIIGGCWERCKFRVKNLVVDCVPMVYENYILTILEYLEVVKMFSNWLQATCSSVPFF